MMAFFLKPFMFFSITMMVCYHSYAETYHEYPTQSVDFYPNKLIILPTPHDDNKIYITQSLLASPLAKNFNFTLTPKQSKTLSDYMLNIEYATGCGAYNPEENCRITFLWTILRRDNAPVGGWRADYPINVTADNAKNRFNTMDIPHDIADYAVNDFLTALTSIIKPNVHHTPNMPITAPVATRNAPVNDYQKLIKKSPPIVAQNITINKTTDSAKIFIAPQETNNKYAYCSPKIIASLLRVHGLSVANTLNDADYILNGFIETAPTDNENLITINIQHLMTHIKSKKSASIPQSSIMENNVLQKQNIDCVGAFGAVIPIFKEFITVVGKQ